jgi:DNA-directed RNA polymerase sigma subunit (sigma70/sigma32)
VAPAEKNKWTKSSVEVKDYDQDGYPIYRTEEKTFSELMQTTSIDASYNNEDLQNNLALIDQFSGVEDLYIKKEQKEFVFSILENDLTDVQRTVINATTDGILGDSVKIKDLQSIYGLTHEGIRKIGKRAEKKIKDKYGKNLSEALKSF